MRQGPVMTRMERQVSSEVILVPRLAVLVNYDSHHQRNPHARRVQENPAHICGGSQAYESGWFLRRVEAEAIPDSIFGSRHQLLWAGGSLSKTRKAIFIRLAERFHHKIVLAEVALRFCLPATRVISQRHS